MSVTCHACGQQWPRNPILEVPCPTCQSRIGSPCLRPSGHRAAELHVEREQAALDAGVLQRCPAGPTAQAQRRQPDLFPSV